MDVDIYLCTEEVSYKNSYDKVKRDLHNFSELRSSNQILPKLILEKKNIKTICIYK